MDRLVRIGDQVGPVTLYDVDGMPVQLAELLDRPTVIPLVRYYGCMPCKAFLYELNDVRGNLESAGLQVIGVGGAADYQGRDLMERGIDFPLLLDPGHTLYEALNIRRIHWWMLLSPITWWKYAQAARRARQGRITDHVLQAPGLAILDTDRTIRFLHRGATFGDYPPVAHIVAAAYRIGSGERG